MSQTSHRPGEFIATPGHNLSDPEAEPGKVAVHVPLGRVRVVGVELAFSLRACEGKRCATRWGVDHLKLNQYIDSNVVSTSTDATETYIRTEDQDKDDAIPIHPPSLGLPWATGILHCRQSKLWKLSVDVAREALEEFATSKEADLLSKTGVSLADIAKQELQSNVEDGWAKFPIYLFSEGDEERTRLLSLINVFIFIFDDFWEATDIAGFSQIEGTFIRSMQPNLPPEMSRGKGTIQSIIRNSISDILALDKVSGKDNGRQMIDRMVQFFTRPPPPDSFSTLRAFLDYRHEDAAAPHVMACVAFSYNLDVELQNPRIAKYVQLFSDHISVVNDIASWEKEKKAYDTGKVLYLINTVAEVKKLFSLDSYESAIRVTLGLQFHIECEIDREIQALIVDDHLTADEKQFIKSLLYAMSGNVLVSTIMTRYGGERLVRSLV
ncbi:hypothetical protein V2A60_005511 [Cordyceps javanica]